MIYIIFNFILACTDIWLIERYLSMNFADSKNKLNKILQFSSIVTMFISHLYMKENLIVSFLLIVLTIVTLSRKYKLGKKDLLTYFIIFIILETVISSLIVMLLNWIFDIQMNYFHLDWSFTYIILVETIVRYIQLIIILYITNLQQKKEITLHHFKSFSIFLSIYFGIVLITNNDKLFIFRNVGRTFVFVIIVYNIALICFDKFQNKHELLEYEHKQLKSETSSDSVYFQEHLKGNNDIRGIKHDMKNHMLILKGYIESDSKKTALEYIQTIENEIEIASSTLHTGIPTVDSIITSKLKTMKESNIAYKEKFKVICLGDVYDRDLALMLASALDNAIEAAIKSEDKKISLHISTEANYLCITLINSIKRNSKPNFKKTSKEDSTKHGFGYKKIKSIVKKYNGSLDTEITKDKVIMTITLKIN